MIVVYYIHYYINNIIILLNREGNGLIKQENIMYPIKCMY